MEWSDFHGKKVGLLGAGVENIALIPHLEKAGADITVCDRNAESPVIDQLKTNNISVVAGKNYLDSLDQFDVVFRIPGLAVGILDQALAKANRKPIVTSAINLFLEMAPCPIIGVTGTKGKGTTSTMIASILSQTGRQVVVGGNINLAVFSFFDDLDKDSIFVLELSSFQLEDVTHSPSIAVLLPITPDHLQPLSAKNPNYHQSFDHYAAAKANITAFQRPNDLLVLAADSETVKKIAAPSVARKIAVGQEGSEADLELTKAGQLLADNKVLLDFKQAGLSGQHLFLDAALATAVGREFGLSADQIIEGLKAFQPLPHRLETVAEIDGITYVNDSYATAPEATIAALSAFTQPIIWLGGGSKKGASFEALAHAIASSTVKKAILIGEEAPRIEATLKELKKVETIKANSLAEAVKLARAAASFGDVVLLSPACASKDMFNDAAERGDQFTELVHQIGVKT